MAITNTPSPSTTIPTTTTTTQRQPIYTPEEVPHIKSAKRLTRIRTKQLLRAAGREYDDPPPRPAPGDCCGSACDPCVMDLWREEMTCWRERWGIESKESGKNMKLDW
ncbi:hypothetical protein ASPZODRAFT_14591 [Penicilliopsis zonata CBS 506.65]|uniref:Oxidoreductase-like domain-containing protein n=1 Tax=Penicilliopsis zonata CBS 506.65 TaxID=1073090 RepID=A0A1L9SN27_9EURO|nr:hypothetical protein ASPZODRAFT_14591 [Penicilliopsis zonata CBS 506.65]OJJ48454.1 hypothetical protein ASPZODRAFT_14591 [Penicilliopsis zonata CBS 506.65]